MGLINPKMVNIAALSSIPTTLMERHIGFWAAYLLLTCIFVVAVILVIFWNSRLGGLNELKIDWPVPPKCIVKLPPQRNVLPHTSQVLLIACRSHYPSSTRSDVD